MQSEMTGEKQGVQSCWLGSYMVKPEVEQREEM